MIEQNDTVMFIDDDIDLLKANVQTLELVGWTVKPFTSAEAALAVLDERFPGVIVCDVRMPDMDGHQFYRRLRALDSDLPVILVTGHGDIAEAVRSIHDGAYDFIAKPYPTEHLTTVVARALDKRRLVLENRRLRELAGRDDPDMAIVGESPAVQALRARIRKLADADVDVLIEGETGVGKALVARALHRQGSRRQRPFVVVDCAGLDQATAESDLFGHEMGAFPGAIRKRVGRIESADRGILFLDEIEALSLPLQGKLLRLLDEREVTPLGASEARPLSLKVIASAKADLAARIAAGLFRADLYYRLDVGRIRVPPLRERASDAALLFTHFLRDAGVRLDQQLTPLTADIQHQLFSGGWPGNVRELRNFAIRVALGFEDGTPVADDAPSLPARLDSYEEHLLREALTLCGGDVRSTIAMLKLPRKTFYEKLKRHGIDIDAYRS